MKRKRALHEDASVYVLILEMPLYHSQALHITTIMLSQN